MRDRNADVKAFLNANIKSTSKLSSVLKATDRLKRMGMYVEDVSEESGYPNFHIRTEEGMVRIYKSPRQGFVVQGWERVQFNYSGIPTFF